MPAALGAIVASGFTSNEPVRLALAVGAVVAVVTAVVGTFTVVRGQSFAGEALADLGATGGAASFLAGVAPIWGFVGATVVAAGAMELIGVQRARGRDLATGIVLGAGLGLTALLLYLVTTTTGASGATVTILFGSLFTIATSTLPIAAALGVAALGLVALAWRPLVLASASPELAAARGVHLRLVGALYLLALALAVALAAVTIGAILSTALLVGPAATAARMSRRPGRAAAGAAAIGIAATWLGILLAYDSYDWPPLHHGWPVSFFVVGLVFVAYLASGPLARRGARG